MRIAVLIAALVAAVGCGAGSSATTAMAPAGTSLTITLWPEGRDAVDSQRWTLRCAPAAGTLRQAATACRKLDAMPNALAPMRRGLVCTDQYGGPQEAVVSGTYEGKRVWIRLAARNGCEISRWKRLAFLVPGGPANSSA